MSRALFGVFVARWSHNCVLWVSLHVGTWVRVCPSPGRAGVRIVYNSTAKTGSRLPWGWVLALSFMASHLLFGGPGDGSRGVHTDTNALAAARATRSPEHRTSSACKAT